MKEDLDIGFAQSKPIARLSRRAGRPRAIPDRMNSVVLGLYRAGNGYRAISRILDSDFDISVDYSSVRRTLRRIGEVR